MCTSDRFAWAATVGISALFVLAFLVDPASARETRGGFGKAPVMSKAIRDAREKEAEKGEEGEEGAEELEEVDEEVDEESEEEAEDDGKKRGEKEPAVTAASLKEDFERGAKALKGKKYSVAVGQFKKVAETGAELAPELAEAAKGKLTEISQVAQKALETALQKEADGDIMGAMDSLGNVRATYSGTPEADQARTRLAALARDPRIACERAFRNAQRYEKSKQMYRALKAYELIASRYEGMPLAAKAAERVQSIRSDKELMESLLGEEETRSARGWVIIGNIHALNNRPEAAKKYYGMVLDRYPDSKYARQAERGIAKLSKKTPKAMSIR